MKNLQKGSVGIIVGIIIAVLAIGGGAYYYQKTKNPVNYSTEFSVPEFGIKFDLPTELQDLTYKVPSDSDTYISFSTKAFQNNPAFYPDCKDEVLGRIWTSKTSPLGGEGPQPDPKEVHYINGVYISYAHPQAACSDDQSLYDLVSPKMDALRKALKTMSAI